MFFKSKKIENQVFNNPLEVVRTFLDGRKFNYKFYAESNVFTLNLSGKNVSWQSMLHVDIERKLLTIRHFSPLMIQDIQKIKVAEFIARINFGFSLGQFKMNFEEAEIFFEATQLFGDDELPVKTLEILFFITSQTFDDYFNLFNKVNMGETEPFLAVLSNED
jgi:hypothetical protein